MLHSSTFPSFSPLCFADSGRGVSRPNSQIDVLDLRVSRTESVGRKSVQSVVAEQGAKSDVGKKHTSEQAIIEGKDSPTGQNMTAAVIYYLCDF